MRYISVITLLVLCLTLLFFTCCTINTGKPEPASGNLENQEDINQSSNNYQNPSTDPVEEPVIEDTGELGTVYPQNWATGDGTAENPWANNCIKKAYDATPADGTIYLKAGYYQLAGNLDLAKQINIIGEGMNKTIIRTANTYGFTIIVAHVTLKGFTIDGDAQTAGDLPIINISNCDYIIVEDVEAKNGISTGVQPFQVNYSSFKNIYAHDNGEHGMHPCSNTTGTNIYNTYRDIYAWNNGDSGFDDRGIGKTTEQTNNIYDNLQCWDNVNHGIALTYQSGIVLSNSVVSGNGVCGIYLKYIEDSTVDNCSVILNDAEGILISAGVKNVNFTNVIVKNNKTGINIYNSSELVFTSCQSYDDRATPLQDYGIELREDANAGLTFLNCKLTPNRKGDIYNPAGVVLTIITEKRE
jgi:parallel beta-helix repeat protein